MLRVHAARALAVVLALTPGPARAAGPQTAPAAVPEAGRLLVLNKSEDTLAVVDLVSLQVTARIPTGKGPHEVAVSPDGRTAYVADYGTREAPGGSISVVDLRSLKPIRTFELESCARPHGIAVGRGGKIYLTCEDNKTLLAIDPAGPRIDRVFETGQEITHMVALTPDGRRAFTANIGSDTVSVVDLETGRVTHIAVGKGPEGLDVSPDGRELWVAHRGDGRLTILETESLKTLATVQACEMPIRTKFSPDGRSVLVSCLSGSVITVFDAVSRQVRTTIPTGRAPIGILIPPDGRRAFIANTMSDKVTVVDLAGWKVTGTIDAGREPDGMAWVPAQGY